MVTQRLFTAIRIPETLALDLGTRVRDALGDARSFRIPRPDGLHLTLLFHGDVESERTDRLSRELDAGIAGCEGFELELSATGAFPRRGSERVLWVGARDAGGGSALERLRAAVLSAGEAAGFDVAEERSQPFHAHVTVARPRNSGHRGAKVPSAFYDLELRASFRAQEVLLLRSVPVAGSAHRYEALRAWSLL